MGEAATKEVKSHWLAAAQLRLASSTFSTLGGDVAVGWIIVAAIPGRSVISPRCDFMDGNPEGSTTFHRHH